MNEDKTALKIALLILGALAVVAALWRVLAYEPSAARGDFRPMAGGTIAQPDFSNARFPVSEQEALDELLPQGQPNSRPQASLAANSKTNPKATPSRRVAYPENRASHKEAYPAQSSAGGQRYVGTNFYPTQQQPVPYAQAAASFYKGGNTSGNSAHSVSARMQEERAQMLAPYLRPNRKQKEQMDAKWAKLSAAIDRAVAQALTPKSKKEQMVEKYAASKNAAAGQSGLTGPFAPVVNAIAAQKNDIVKSFAQSFGASAAKEASQLMDSFAGEVAAAASAPGLTSQQAAAQVKEIAKKYEKKMDKLAEKSQYDKFVADRVAQDNKQKAELGALYPEEKVQIGQLIDQTREKDLALATQNLPREEYFNQLAQNNQALRSGIQKLVTQGGKSVQDFQKWEQGQTQAYLEKLGQLEEAGQIQSVARVATPDEKRKTQADIDAQKPKFLDGIEKSFGPQAKADFEPIFENYERTLKQIDEAKLSPLERETQRANATKEANRELFSKKIEYVEKMNIPDEQKQAALNELRQAYNNIK